MIVSTPPAEVDVGARLPRALAAAWHASLLYEPSHPAVASSIDELCRASRIADQFVWVQVDAGVLVMSGRALEPVSDFQGFAQFLHRASIAGLEFCGELQPAIVRAALLAMKQHRQEAGAGDGRLADRLNEAGQGVLLAHEISASAVKLSPLSRSATARKISFAVLATAGIGAGATGGSGGAGGAAAAALSRAAAGDFRQCLGAARGKEASPSPMASLQQAFAELSPAQRAELITGLGDDENVSFDEAAGILALLPVEQMTSFIDVLMRKDSHLSTTSLRLLKRLANLSLGSKTDMGRLAQIAEQWTHKLDANGTDHDLAEATATLLRKLNTTETKSEEYTELLRELSQAGSATPSGMVLKAADEEAQVGGRTAECICEVLRNGVGDPEERVAMLRQLAERGRALAAAGNMDSVFSILQLAEELVRAPMTPSDCGPARELGGSARREEWVERVLGSCSDTELIQAALTRRELKGQAAADALVRAVAYCGTPARKQALMSVIETLPAEEVAQAIREAIKIDAVVGEALGELVRQRCPGDYVALFKSGVVHQDRRQRMAAHLALARLVPTWPHDLCVRGMLDSDSEVRFITIEQLARQRDRSARILVDRLAGATGGSAIASDEAARIKEAVAADRRPWVTRRLATRLIGASVAPQRAQRGCDLAEALRGRRSLLGWTARVAWLLSPFRWLRAKGRKARS